VFPVRYGHRYRIELSSKGKTGRQMISRVVIVVLMYHRHKPIDKHLCLFNLSFLPLSQHHQLQCSHYC
jgi:hypothetical protein